MTAKHKEELLQIRKAITRIGYEMLAELLPMEIDEVKKFSKPFAKIEKLIDKIIDNENNRT